jgi:hypothetical protein
MTRDEFEENRRRFGDDFNAWPAPYRQQGRDFLEGRAGAAGGEDKALDRLVLEAAAAETDEQALTRKVLARIDEDRARAPFWSWAWLSPAAMAASVVAVLAAATAAGYTLGADEGSLESDLIAFAIGAPELAGDDLPGIGEEGEL